MKTKLIIILLILNSIWGFSQISYTDINPDTDFLLVDNSSQTAINPIDIDSTNDYEFRYDAYSSTDFYIHIVPKNNILPADAKRCKRLQYNKKV